MADSFKDKLYAINVMLQNINELTIDSLEDLDAVEEARIADTVLDEVKTDVLSEGWDINTDVDWEFAPDTSGIISIPYNVLDLSDDDGNVQIREWKLYDTQNKTFEFEDVQICKVIWDVDFNNLTHPIRKYINIKAARIFQVRMIGDRNSFGFTEKDEAEAKVNARRSENRTGKYSMRTTLATSLNRTSL